MFLKQTTAITYNTPIPANILVFKWTDEFISFYNNMYVCNVFVCPDFQL